MIYDYDFTRITALPLYSAAFMHGFKAIGATFDRLSASKESRWFRVDCQTADYDSRNVGMDDARWRTLVLGSKPVAEAFLEGWRIGMGELGPERGRHLVGAELPARASLLVCADPRNTDVHHLFAFDEGGLAVGCHGAGARCDYCRRGIQGNVLGQPFVDPVRLDKSLRFSYCDDNHIAESLTSHEPERVKLMKSYLAEPRNTWLVEELRASGDPRFAFLSSPA